MSKEQRLQEKSLRDSWGYRWNYLLGEQRRNGGFYLLFGDWSGYVSSQRRITHVDYISKKEAEALKLKRVQFTDNTTMSIWVEKVTTKDILSRNLYRNKQYESLISEASKSGDSFYQVTPTQTKQ